MQPQVLEFVDLDAHVVHDAKAPHPLHELVPLERVGRPRHDVHLHPTAPRADQALDDDHVLEALVLDEQPVPRVVDELADPIPPGVLGHQTT